MNPYELGVFHAKTTGKSNNPYPEFSAKWGMYNHGFNKTKYPELFN